MQVHVACIQKLPDEVEKPLIVDLLVQERDQGSVIQLVEAGAYIPFDEPVHPSPFLSEFSQSRVTTALWSKPMTAVAEVGFARAIVNGFEDETDHLLHDFVPHARHTRSTLP